MFCTTCFGHPQDCGCGVLQPINSAKAIEARAASAAQWKEERAKPPPSPATDPMFPNDGISRTFNGYIVHCGRCGKPKTSPCRLGSCKRG